MASPKRRLAANAAGDFFVDDSCIDCGACRWIAPGTFDYAGGQSRVCAQPGTEEEQRRALMALVACPTASIGTTEKHDIHAVEALFPEHLESGVYYAGYHSPDSYGAASWLIVRPEGNVLVDCPRFARPLVRRLEALGGVSLMFLTHQDDVADHEKYRAHFGLRRIMHEADAVRGCEIVLRGEEPIAHDEKMLFIPVPGHTRGSTCLLYDGRFLFTGDHLWWNLEERCLEMSRSVAWYSWPKQVESGERLAGYAFEWVLPGHGDPVHLPKEQMAEELRKMLRTTSR